MKFAVVIVVVAGGSGCAVAIACDGDDACPDDVPVCIDGFCGVGSGDGSEGEGEGEEGKGEELDGDGSCNTPFEIGLPYDVEGEGDGRVDGHDIDCAEAFAIREVVYVVDVPVGVDLLVSANDSSGQGIGVEVREGTCRGAVRSCFWQANGDLVDERVITSGGPAVVIVERNPDGGPFDFSIRIDE